MASLYRFFLCLLLPTVSFAQSYNPNPTAKAIPVCEGQPIYLYAQWTPPPSGTTVTFFWSGPNSFTSNTFTPLVPYSAAAMSGPYSLTIAYTGNNTGFATSSVTPALGTPKVNASGRTADIAYWSKAVVACAPSSLSLSMDFQGHPTSTTYLWTGPNSYSSNSRSPIVTGSPVPAGSYVVKATFPGTCGVAKDTVSLTAPPFSYTSVYVSVTNSNNKPVFELCPGTTAVLTAIGMESQPSSTSYVWRNSTGTVLSTSPALTVLSSHTLQATDYYQVTVSSSCAESISLTQGIYSSTPQLGVTGRTSSASGSYGLTTCPVTSYSLSASTSNDAVQPTYSWTGPNNFNSTDQSPVVTGNPVPPGIYTCTASFPNGCGINSVTGSIQYQPRININVPEGQFGATGIRVCANRAFTMTASYTFGSSPLSTTYVWAGPNGFAASGSTVTVVNGAAGMYKVTMKYSGACSGTVVRWQTITIGPPAVQIYSSRGTSCPVNTLDLNVYPNTSSATYAWTGPGGFTSTSPNPTVTGTPVASGLYSLTTTFPNGCGSMVSTYSLAYDSPTLGVTSYDVAGNRTSRYCPNSTVILTANTYESASSYVWVGPTGAIGTTKTITVANASAGSYSVTATYTGSCATTLTSTHILTIGPPLVNARSEVRSGIGAFDQICPGSTIVLTASSQTDTPDSFRWKGPNNYSATTATATLTNVTSAMSGIYSVTATYSGTCTGYSVNFLTLAVETPSSTILQRSLVGYMASIFTPASICDGSLLGFTASSSYWWQDVSPQPTYSWERPNGQIIDGPSELDVPNTTASDAGRYILTTTFGANCNYAAVKDTVYINYRLDAPKLITSQGVIAYGSSVTLTATNCPAFSPYGIVWSNQMTGKSIVVAPTVTTTYRATCTANNCTSNPSNPLTITVLNQPLADVALRMRTSRRIAKVGEPISVTITAVNKGTTPASNLQIMSRLPASVGLANLGDMQSVVGGVQGTITSLLPGDMQELVFAVHQQQPGTSRLAAQITASDNPDSDSWPNSGTNDGQDDVAWVDLRTEEAGSTYASPEPNPAILPTVQQTPFTLPEGFADVGLTIALSNRSPTVGDVISISLTLTNDQSSRMLTPLIRCTLPAGISFLNGNGVSANGQEVTVAGGIYFCVPALTFSFQAQVIATGTKTIFTEIQSCDWPDPDSTPSNGYTNGEDDTAQAELRVR